jgi:hypothetical protein
MQSLQFSSKQTSLAYLAALAMLVLLLLLLYVQDEAEAAAAAAASSKRRAPELEDTGVVGERAIGKGKSWLLRLKARVVTCRSMHNPR